MSWLSSKSRQPMGAQAGHPGDITMAGLLCPGTSPPLSGHISGLARGRHKTGQGFLPQYDAIGPLEVALSPSRPTFPRHRKKKGD